MTGRRRRGAVWSLAPRNEDFGGSNWPYASAGEKSLDPTAVRIPPNIKATAHASKPLDIIVLKTVGRPSELSA